MIFIVLIIVAPSCMSRLVTRPLRLHRLLSGLPLNRLLGRNIPISSPSVRYDGGLFSLFFLAISMPQQILKMSLLKTWTFHLPILIGIKHELWTVDYRLWTMDCGMWTGYKNTAKRVQNVGYEMLTWCKMQT